MSFWEKVVVRARKHCCLTASVVFVVIVVFAFAIIALIWQFLTKTDLGIEERTLTSFGSWICGLFALMLVLDGYILSFLYHAPELTVFAG